MSFVYHDGELTVATPTGHRSVKDFAIEGEGPFYIYNLQDVRTRFQAMAKALSGLKNTVHYAMKANSHPELLKCLAALGAGVDTVSAGEIKKALAAGIAPQKVIFSGVAKTISEIEFALRSGIKQINVESPQELERIGQIAKRLGVVADVAWRMNPDVNPKTHPYITTGFRENKFGMDESFLPSLFEIMQRHSQSLKLRGVTMHIGSLLFDLEVMGEAIQKLVKVHQTIEAKGYKLDRFDIGGGIGIHYETDDVTAEMELLKKYGELVHKLVTPLMASNDVELLTEPGRILVGRCGMLVGEVQYIKETQHRSFVILNTGMHHLIRPALYSAKHRVLPLKRQGGSRVTYDVVGPICESSDFLAKGVELETVRAGDFIAIADAGAYGFSMASQYNSHELPREVVIDASGNLVK